MIGAALCAALSVPADADGAPHAALQQLTVEWDQARYAAQDDRTAYAALSRLAREAEELAQTTPNDPALFAWRGLIAASQADVSDGFRALRHVREAKTFLDNAAAGNPDTTTRSLLYMTLGELTLSRQDFPISIGNRQRAEEAFQTSLSADPDALEANVAYGDFLIGENTTAKRSLFSATLCKRLDVRAETSATQARAPRARSCRAAPKIGSDTECVMTVLLIDPYTHASLAAAL